MNSQSSASAAQPTQGHLRILMSLLAHKGEDVVFNGETYRLSNVDYTTVAERACTPEYAGCSQRQDDSEPDACLACGLSDARLPLVGYATFTKGEKGAHDRVSRYCWFDDRGDKGFEIDNFDPDSGPPVEYRGKFEFVPLPREPPKGGGQPPSAEV